MVKGLGYSENVYIRAKEKQENRSGGEKTLTTLRGWKKLRQRNIDDVEDFLGVLDQVLRSLQDRGPFRELTGQNLNLTAKEKVSEEDVQAYKYWCFEGKKEDNFESLILWLELKVKIIDLKSTDEKYQYTKAELNHA